MLEGSLFTFTFLDLNVAWTIRQKWTVDVSSCWKWTIVYVYRKSKNNIQEYFYQCCCAAFQYGATIAVRLTAEKKRPDIRFFILAHKM